jgi:tetraprenyl-beta-curcumene synthase
MAFQAAYDFVDTLAEQPCAEQQANGRRLHLVLLAALDPDRAHLDYYAHSPTGDDGGYLVEMADACRDALRRLPSYAAVRPACLRAARRMVAYQALTHAAAPSAGQRPQMRRWAERLASSADELRWWEAAAGAASSLSVFALIAAAAQPRLGARETSCLEHAYFPSVGALHVLLDSLIDSEADLACDHHSLVSHYGSPAETADRLGMLARRAGEAVAALPAAARHEAVLAAMVCFYLSSPAAAAMPLRPARGRVLAESNGLTGAAMTVLRARRAIERGPPRKCAYPGRLLESQVVDFPLAARRTAQR